MIIGGRALRCHCSHLPAFAVALWILTLTAAPHHLSAQDVVLHRFISRNPDPKIEKLLYLAAGVELVREGISSTRSGKDENYVLVTRYSASQNTVTVNYTLLSPDESDRPLASMETMIPINQNLDLRVAEIIGKLMKAAGIKAVPSSKAEIVGVLSEAPVSSAQPNVPIKTAGPKSTPSAASPAYGVPRTSLPTSGLPPMAPTRIAAKRPQLRFQSTVSAAGVLFFGQMAEYFHYGAAGSTNAGLAWQTQRMGFGLAARFSVVRAFNDPGVIGGSLYLSTAGLNLHLGSGSGRLYRLSAELSGGAAFLTVVGTHQTQTKTAPYGDAGLSAFVPIGRRFLLGGSIRFLMIFDKGLLVMGVVPAVTLGNRH